MIQYLTNCYVKRDSSIESIIKEKKNRKNSNVTSQPIVVKINKYIK